MACGVYGTTKMFAHKVMNTGQVEHLQGAREQGTLGHRPGHRFCGTVVVVVRGRISPSIRNASSRMHQSVDNLRLPSVQKEKDVGIRKALNSLHHAACPHPHYRAIRLNKEFHFSGLGQGPSLFRGSILGTAQVGSKGKSLQTSQPWVA